MVHDFFDLIGLSENAPLGEIRRSAQKVRRPHPDFRLTRDSQALGPTLLDAAVPRDAAVDFVDVGTLFDRIESAFFGQRP